jgi:hypothetical protein
MLAGWAKAVPDSTRDAARIETLMADMLTLLGLRCLLDGVDSKRFPICSPIQSRWGQQENEGSVGSLQQRSCS